VAGGSYADHKLGINLNNPAGLQTSLIQGSGTNGTPILYAIQNTGATIGEIAISQTNAELTFSFTNGVPVTTAIVNELLRAVTYEYTGAPVTAATAFNVNYTLNDRVGATNRSATQNIAINVGSNNSSGSNVLNFSSNGGITSDFDNDPNTATSFAPRLTIEANNTANGGVLSNSDLSFGSSFASFSPTPLAIDTIVAPDDGINFINSSDRSFTIIGGAASDTLQFDFRFNPTTGASEISTVADYFDGGGQSNTRSGDAVNIVKGSIGSDLVRVSTTLDLTAKDVNGWSQLKTNWGTLGTAIDFIKNIEQVNASYGNDLIKSGSIAGYDTSAPSYINFFSSSRDLYTGADFKADLSLGDDTFVGGDGRDWVDGGDGNDNLDGGGGVFDTVSWVMEQGTDVETFANFQGISLDLNVVDADGFVRAVGQSNPAIVDRLKNFESYQGSQLDDLMIGDDLSNQFTDASGADNLRMGGGNDLVVLVEDDAADTVALGVGNDVLVKENSFATDILSTDILSLKGSRSDYAISQVFGTQLSWIGGINRSFGGEFIQIEGIGTQFAEGVDHISLGAIEKFRFADGTDLTQEQLLNQSPIAADDAIIMREDEPILIDVLSNDSDPDGNPLTISSFNIAPSVAAELPVTIENNKLRITPSANFNGFRSFSYTVADGQGGTATANVSIDVLSISDAPVTANSAIALNEDNTRILTLADFPFSDPNDFPPNIFMGVLISVLPTQGVIKLNGVAINANELIYLPSISEGKLTYTPNANYNGTDGFTFQVADGGSPMTGGSYTSLPAKMAITINSVNDAAVITGATTGIITEDATPNNISGDLNSVDIDNPSPADGWQAVTTATASANGYGNYTMSATGFWSYALNNSNTAVNALNNGQSLTDTFTVQTIDGTSQTVTVTINGATDATIFGTNASNTLFGTAAADNINALGGNDTVYGLGGNDTIQGGAGNDDLYGDLAPVLRVYVGTGNDFLDGGEGNDRLFGGRGNDRLLGGAGNDRLGGGPGDDILTGGSGPDIFIFEPRVSGFGREIQPGMGSDIITDFVVAGADQDQIDLSAFNTSFRRLSLATSGTDTIIKIADQEGSITLVGIDKTLLSAGDFIFR
jgi:VCBS repeat-containing protein